MSSSKGKGKGPASQNQGDQTLQEQQQPPQPSSSLLSRIGNSASALSRSTFTAPSSNELSERAAAGLASAGKGQSLSGSSASGSAWTETGGPSRTQNAVPGGAGGSSGSLRVGHSQAHIERSEEEFSSFLDGIDSFTPSENLVGSSDLSAGALGDGGLSSAWERSQATALSQQVFFSVAEQENRDGDDVLALLSGSGPMEDAFQPPEEEGNYDWGLSPQQLSQIRAIMNENFPPPEKQKPVPADHPLNLNANFESQVHTQGMTFAPQEQSVVPEEAWRPQWEGVLARYTDEVWGDLLPLVREAREEMENLPAEGSVTEQPKALRRLHAILGHLRQG